MQAIEGLSLRDTVVRIADSDFLRDFVRTRKKAVMDRSFLDRCLRAVRPATWKRINELLARAAAAQEKIDPSVVRTNATVVDANIRWPTDASLLWDTWRVASRVPARERVFSIFEPHVELIDRGRREKPVEFGHGVLLCQTAEKFITDYAVFAERPADCELTEEAIGRHEELFGKKPEVPAADKGFCPAAEKYAEREEQVATLAIPRRMRDFADNVLVAWQKFRAGIEGTISGLKRAFRLARRFFRGLRNFQSAVGLGVFALNLIVLAAQGMT